MGLSVERSLYAAAALLATAMQLLVQKNQDLFDCTR
jgi:hypothetical protein